MARGPKPGDRAWHKDGLDPRTVVRVLEVNGQPHVTLDFWGNESSPMPAANYDFQEV